MVEKTFQIVVLAFLFLLHLLAVVALLRGTGSLRHKLCWTVALLTLPAVGAAAYMIWGRGPRDAPMAP